MTAKDIVLGAVRQLFGDQEASAVDRWVASDFRQHGSLAADGPEGLRHLMQTLPAGVHYELHRVIESSARYHRRLASGISTVDGSLAATPVDSRPKHSLVVLADWGIDTT